MRGSEFSNTAGAALIASTSTVSMKISAIAISILVLLDGSREGTALIINKDFRAREVVFNLVSWHPEQVFFQLRAQNVLICYQSDAAGLITKNFTHFSFWYSFGKNNPISSLEH